MTGQVHRHFSRATAQQSQFPVSLRLQLWPKAVIQHMIERQTDPVLHSVTAGLLSHYGVVISGWELLLLRLLRLAHDVSTNQS